MKKTFILMLICYGCSNAPKTKVDSSDKVIISNLSPKPARTQTVILPGKSKIAGIWTDGNSENATFDIGKDSIYYVDQFKSYKYSVTNDSIKIYYTDFTYRAKISFIKDTLVMSSPEYDVAKFWKFKN